MKMRDCTFSGNTDKSIRIPTNPLTIEEAFAAIPNATCTRRTGGLAPPDGHAKDCERCAAIRTFGETVLEEAERTGGYDSLAPAGVTLRARIAAQGRQT